MTAQPLRLFGDPVLRAPAVEVTAFDDDLRRLVRALWDTMEAHRGAGLAAPQIGVGLRVFTYHCDGAAGHLVNPTLEVLGDEVREAGEGCLSIPDLTTSCRRHRSVLARGWNMRGEPVEVRGGELLSRCLQHETDHLNGVLYLDRVSSDTRQDALERIRTADWFGHGRSTPDDNPNPSPGRGR
ncbi:peptide deformylase [Actinoalloteichus sp. AHMU CJ021]|uniref:peptide deformylase n=1 Tax=Actinoalloteichus TaxID=65496 RepID=UPI000CA086A5|nr:peptide deformylase [Actinoalloteichus sp. AHMU CJ021]